MYPNYVDHSNSLEPSKKPINVLIKQLHGNIEVVLKNGWDYKGKMIKVDEHMNILPRRCNRIQKRADAH